MLRILMRNDLVTLYFEASCDDAELRCSAAAGNRTRGTRWRRRARRSIRLTLGPKLLLTRFDWTTCKLVQYSIALLLQQRPAWVCYSRPNMSFAKGTLYFFHYINHIIQFIKSVLFKKTYLGKSFHPKIHKNCTVDFIHFNGQFFVNFWVKRFSQVRSIKNRL